MPDLVYKLGLGLYARNENSGLFEPVDRTNDARKALKVQTELAQPLTSAQLTSAELATAGKQDELKVVIGSTTDPDTADTGVGIWKNIRSTLANIASDTLQMVLTWLPILGAIRDRLPPVLDVDGGVKVHVQNPATGGASEATLATFKTEAKTESDETQVKIDELLTQVEAQAVADGGVPARSQSGSFLDGITVTSETPTTVIPAATGKLARTIILPNEETNPAAVFVQTGSAATRLTKKIQPGDTLRLSTNQAVSVLVDGPTSTGRQFFRDSSSFGHDGELVGTPKPTLVASPFAGFGNAAEFDGVDRGANSQGVDLGTSQDFALRGQTGASYEAAVRALNPASYWRMNETTGDMLDQMPHQPYLSKVLPKVQASGGSLWRLGETSGNFMDSGPAGIQGVVSGTPTRGVASIIQPSQAAGNLALAGPCTVDFGQNYKFLGRQSFSVEWWVSTAVNMDVVVGNQSSPSGRWLFYLSSFPQRIVSFHRAELGTSTAIIVPFDYALHSRLHIVGTYDGTTMVLYAQGQEIARLASTLEQTTSSAPLLLSINSAGQKVDELAIYPNRALTAAEVQEHFTYGTSKIGACHGVVSGLVTRNVVSLVTPNQNNPFGDVNGSARFDDVTGQSSKGVEAYRLGGKQPFSVFMLKADAGTLRYGNEDAAGGWSIVWGATSVVYTRRNGALTDTVTAPFTVPPLTAAVVDNGTTAAIYLNGAQVVTQPVSQVLALNTAALLLQSTSGVARVDDAAIFLRALSAAEIAALHQSATVWDGGTPKTFDIRHRPDILQNAAIAARENASTLDWSLESTAVGAHKLRYQNADGAVEILSGGAYAAASPEVLRVTDDRTAVTLSEIVAGVLTPLATSFKRPHPDTVTVETYTGRNAKTASVGQFDGAVDELRVSNIVCTDSGAAPYVNDANTLALIHFDAIDSELSGPPVTQKIYPYVSETDE